MDPSMTLGSGLSGLTIGGITVQSGPNGPMAGGRLAANFALRDSAGPEVQQQLDVLATALISRFQDTATDVTIAPGAPGLFTDSGSALTPPAAPGLAGRLAVNPLVLPDEGGVLWRLRDGLGAAAPGPVGNAAGIGALLGALERPIAATPGSPARNLAAHLADLGATLSTARNRAEDSAALDAARHAELTERVLESGVDTDAEMQRLISIEQAYAANARAIQTADTMLQRLLEI
jgi:flagellar hook-associated protein 1 FlgK